MQTIWNRVAQSRCTCNCSSCLSSAAAIARRSTTAAAGRRIRFSDIFTVFYSSMLATAAVADSNRKDARREAWDKAIAQAKDELKDLESQQRSRLAALSIKPSGEQIIQETKGEHWSDVFEWASRQRERRTALGFHDWKGIPLHVLEGLSGSDIQRAVADSRISSRLGGEAGSAAWDIESHSRPLSTKKLKTLEWSVAKMTLRIMSQTSKDGLAIEDGRDSIEDTSVRPFLRDEQDLSRAILSIDERLSELRKHSQASDIHESLESPQYPRYSSGSITYRHESNSLNATLRAILNTRQQKGAGHDALLAKVCYNLLMSTTPPNVHTYNMLLVRFCHWEEQGLVSALLTSMRESHIRPNEITHETILKFYTLIENRSAFAKYVRLMEGLDRALAIAHPETKRIPITAGRYRFPEDHQNSVAQFARGRDGAPVPVQCDMDTNMPVRQSNITEKARVNKEVYGALIHGALKFFGKEQAMQFYRAMIGEGWNANLTILTSILRHCCYKEDWPSGVAVWQEIQRRASGAHEQAYSWMLRLCRRCQQQIAFEEVLSDGTRRGILPSTVWDLGTQIQTAEVNTLMINAKQLRNSQRQKEAQRAGQKSPRIGSGVKQRRQMETTQSVEVLEPYQNQFRIENLIVPPKLALTEPYNSEADRTVTVRPTERHRPSSEDKGWNRDTAIEPVTLSHGPIKMPALYYNENYASSPQPTTCPDKTPAHQPPPNLPMIYRRPLTPQRIPDQSFWERVEEPMAATA